MELKTKETTETFLFDAAPKIKEITETFNNKLFNKDFTQEDVRDGLFEGQLGILYYLFNLYKIEQTDIIADKISEILNDVFSRVSEGNYLISVSTAFSYGLSGFGYITNELVKNDILEEGVLSFFDDINDYIYETAIKDFEKGNFDFMEGFPGALHYLQSIDHAHCTSLIDKKHDALGQTKYPFYNHITELYNKGINFGIAHGILGVLTVMLEIFKKDKTNPKVKDIITHCLTVIFEAKKEAQAYGITTYYPYNLFYDGEELVSHPTNRLAWCSGDLAVALVLYKAGVLLDREDCITLSNMLGKASIKRKTIEETGIHMPMFCHGTSGAACMYKKLYELSNNDIYHEAYQYWFAETISYLEKEVNGSNENYYNMLLGYPGAILTINNHNDAIMGWDSVFLI